MATLEEVARAIAAAGGECDANPQIPCFAGSEEDGDPPECKCLDQAQAAITTHTAALKEAGYVIVPVEPTEAMTQRGIRCLGYGAPNSLAQIYKAMIAKASDD